MHQLRLLPAPGDAGGRRRKPSPSPLHLPQLGLRRLLLVPIPLQSRNHRWGPHQL